MSKQIESSIEAVMCVVGEQGYEEQNLMNVLFIGPQKRQTVAAYFLVVKCTQVKGFSTREPTHTTHPTGGGLNPRF